MSSNGPDTLRVIDAFSDFCFSPLSLFLEKHDLTVLRDRLLVSFKGELESIPVLMELWFEYLEGSPTKLVAFYERANERKETSHYENLIVLFLISFLAELLAGLVLVEYSRNHDRIVELIREKHWKSQRKISATIQRVSDKYGACLEYLFRVYILKEYVEKTAKGSYAKFCDLMDRIKSMTILRGEKKAELPEDFIRFEESFLRNHSLPSLDENYAQKLGNEFLSLSIVSHRKPQTKRTVSSTKPIKPIEPLSALRSNLSKKLSGLPTNQGYAAGKAKIVLEKSDSDNVEEGDIVVLIEAIPDLATALRRASALIADESGIAGHASIVGRELGLPTIVKTKEGTKVLKDGMYIFVDAVNGIVYEIIQ